MTQKQKEKAMFYHQKYKKTYYSADNLLAK